MNREHEQVRMYAPGFVFPITCMFISLYPLHALSTSFLLFAKAGGSMMTRSSSIVSLRAKSNASAAMNCEGVENPFSV